MNLHIIQTERLMREADRRKQRQTGSGGKRVSSEKHGGISIQSGKRQTGISSELGDGRSPPAAHLHVDVGAVVDEVLEAERAVRGGGCEVQRREALVVGLADAGAVIDEFAHHRVLPVEAGQVQGRVAEGVGFVDLDMHTPISNCITCRLSVPSAVPTVRGARAKRLALLPRDPTSTARLSRCLTTLIWPLEAAAWRGVYPRLSLQLISAPWLTRRRTTSR